MKRGIALVYLIGLILVLASVSAVEHSYSFTLTYADDTFSHENLGVVPYDVVNHVNPLGNWVVHARDVSGKSIYSTQFDMPLIAHFENEDGEEEAILLPAASHEVFINYYEETVELTIDGPAGEQLYSIDVSDFSSVQDARGIVQDTTQPVEPVGTTMSPESESIIHVVLTGVIILAIVIMIFKQRKTKKRKKK